MSVCMYTCIWSVCVYVCVCIYVYVCVCVCIAGKCMCACYRLPVPDAVAAWVAGQQGSAWERGSLQWDAADSDQVRLSNCNELPGATVAFDTSKQSGLHAGWSVYTCLSQDRCELLSAQLGSRAGAQLTFHCTSPAAWAQSWGPGSTADRWRLGSGINAKLLIQVRFGLLV